MQRSITIPVMALFLALVLALPAVGAAVPSPLESMKGNVQKVMDVLKDPALKAADKRDERRKTLRGLADRIFDWVELSKRTLARSWNDLSVDQKREFVNALRRSPGKDLQRPHRVLLRPGGGFHQGDHALRRQGRR